MSAKKWKSLQGLYSLSPLFDLQTLLGQNRASRCGSS